ncbi:HPP family protein [Halomonas sp. McH1-25]|uniref:HPP family protein n=1 Tax=unclassified Halomonas TaxID=2609666 RepID=UPI001EF4E781|nr:MULTISPECIES: HPP family protein [unclassified Halomonas]MCG7599867.1 HPP family protein [Halomonas sp. McH1-25]MCP1343043.1 HPP family protein [Halomonas sp. FL8]MCP1361589.1 HPP family protein [Halomonas sp. BBD45]MCP1365667.1 HPP family protein [Halomonas sp. BBD48]
MVKSYLGKMKGVPIERSRPCWRDALWSWFGAFVGMAGVGWLSGLSLEAHSMLMVGSFGATSVLLYAAPESPLAQPRNVLGGNVISALIGVLSWQWLGDSWLAAAVAVSTAILAMQLTHTLHPPGGATALIAVIGTGELHSLGWTYAFMPVAAGCMLMLGVAILVNNLARHRRYPQHWW